ncbi:MAG: hypothetical protein AB1641_10835 [Thermodesulfobacteriota bacterium]
MNKILFITESYTTAIRLVPVYLEALKRPDVEPIMFTSSPPEGGLKTLFSRYSISTMDGGQLLSPEDKKTLSAWQAEYSVAYAAELGKYKGDEFNYMGVPLLARYGGYFLNWNLNKLVFMYLFDKLAERHRPDLVMVAYDSGGSKKQYVTRAKELGIKTLHVQYSFYPQKKQFDRKWINSDYYCLWGEAHLKPFINEEEKRKNAFFTGNPTFDLFPVERLAGRGELGIRPEDRVFLVGIAQMYDLERFVREIVDYRDGHQAYFIIKLHPDYHDKVTEASALMKDLDLKYRIIGTEIEPYKLLSVADYLVTFDQDTLWLESYYYGVKPILMTSGRDRPELAFDFLEGSTIILRHFRELNHLSTIEKEINPLDVEEARRLLFFRADHRASPRVLDVAQGLISGN